MANEATPLCPGDPDSNLEQEPSGTRDTGTHQSSPSERRPTPIPWKSLLIVQLLTAAQPFALDIVYPFINQMILEIGVVDDPKKVGFYSGLVMSVYPAMSFIAILPASHLSDIIGRKPVVLGGLSGMAVSVVWFGLSKSFVSLMLSRSIAGMLGGVWPCTKVIIAELTDKTNQDIAFQRQLFAYKLGQLISLSLGGFLSHPERNSPFFNNSFWKEYPFALPCFVAGALAATGVTLGLLFLEETAPKKKVRTRSRQSYGSVISTVGASTSISPELGRSPSPKPKKARALSYQEALTGPVISVMLVNLTMSFISEALLAVLPLFCFTPIESGGLGMSEATIGTQMAIRSFLQLGIIPFYSSVARFYGSTIQLHQHFTWLWALSVLYLPLLNALARINGSDNWIMMAAFFVFSFIWSLSGFTWLTLAIMITNATPSPQALSTVNGLAQLTVTLPQALAPAFVTFLFAFSIESGAAGGNLIWIVFFLIALVGSIHSMALKESIVSWREEIR